MYDVTQTRHSHSGCNTKFIRRDRHSMTAGEINKKFGVKFDDKNEEMWHI